MLYTDKIEIGIDWTGGLKVIAKISMYLYVALLINQEVLWLQISVDEIQGVKVFKGQYNLGCVEAGMWFTATHTSLNIYSQTQSG